MTSNADFKRRVRDRMQRTGERYMAARAHLLRGTDTAAGTASSPVGGLQSDVAAVANALARAGVPGPTGAPMSELDVFGLAGGIGFMVAVFVYEGFGPTMTITTRTVSLPDPFVDAALSRAGACAEVRTTGSPGMARRQLDEAIDAGHQVLLSVDTSALPYHGGDLSMAGAGPRVVGVAGRDGGDYLLDDRSVVPLRVDPEALAAARNAVRKARHRMVVVTGPADGHDPAAATRGALERTLDGYDEPPARSFATNVGTAGLRTWAGRLTDTTRKGWARTFAEPAHLHYGLRRVVECIHHELTAEAAGRPLYGAWLRRAGDLLALPEIAAVGEAFEASADRWRAIADLAAGADPSVAEAVDLLEASHRLLDERGGEGAGEARVLRARLDRVRATAALGGADAGELLTAMAEHVTAIAEGERAALDELGASLGR